MRILKPIFRFKSVRTLIAIVAVLVVIAGALLVGTIRGGSSSVPQSAHAASAQAAYYPICQPYYNYWHGIYTGYAIVSFDLCYNGSQVWQGNWGPNCSYIMSPGWSANQTWCGVYNSGGSYVDVGSNVTVSGYGFTYQCWMRVRVNSNGWVTGVRGC